MLIGTRYLTLFARTSCFLDADKGGGGGGGDEGGDEGEDDADDDDDEGEDDADDEDSESDPASVAADRDKWKKISRKHEQRAKANAKAAKELAELKKKGLPDDQRAVTEAEERGRTAAAADFAQQLAGARIEAALTGIVDDPADLVEELNLAKYVTDDNEVDHDAIDELKDKWAARMGSKNEGDDDGDKPKKKADLKQGKRGKSGGGTPEQLTRDALQSMTPEQIEAARASGQLNDLLGIKA